MNYLKICSLLLALLVVGAGSAEAQECVAKAAAANVRAEGVTEQIGTITLRCRGARAGENLGFGTSAVDKLEIAVALNADVTNAREGDDNDMIGNMENVNADGSDTTAGYSNGMVVLTARALSSAQAVEGDDLDANFSNGAVSDDLQTVTWKVVDGEADDEDAADHGLTDEIGLFRVAPIVPGVNPGETNQGFELTIAGLRADASAIGDGGEITATVSVNGSEVGSYTAANVMNGIDVSVDDAEGPECEDTTATAKITIKEGYKKNAFMGSDKFTITFRNIPEGVSVMVPAMTGAIDTEHEGKDLQLVLDEGGPGDGVADPDDDGMAMVELTASGMGSVMYRIGMTEATDPTPDQPDSGDEVAAMTTASESLDAQEWVDLMVTFKWDGGGVTMNNDAMVYVSFHPTGGSNLPRFVGDGDADMPLSITDCVTMLTFPFVSSASGYDTGIVVSNTKDASGSCTASYSGSDDMMTSPMIEGNSHWIFLVSSHMQDYSGRLTVECDFGGIDGYAQINDHMGNANGYLPRGDF